jgi:hypothetical protein
MLERLQLALSGDAPHVLILDGLERVQSEEDGRHRRGELEDLQLKRLVRALAGGLGNARALVTSRFPLVDLESWTGAGQTVSTSAASRTCGSGSANSPASASPPPSHSASASATDGSKRRAELLIFASEHPGAPVAPFVVSTAVLKA